MKKKSPSSTKNSSSFKQDLEKFASLIVEALRFADQSELDWSTIVSASIYETSEYACFKSNGSLPVATNHILNSLGMSMIKRINCDEFFEGYDHDEISISIKSKLRTDTEKNNLVMMLITALAQISDDLSDLNSPDRARLH